MKTIASALLAASLTVSNVFAATDTAPLAPGKPAGVHKAQGQGTTLIWALGAGLVIGGIALVSTKGGDQTPSASSVSSTSASTP